MQGKHLKELVCLHCMGETLFWTTKPHGPQPSSQDHSLSTRTVANPPVLAPPKDKTKHVLGMET